MTYRERRLAKADRLRGWAEKREQDAAAVFKTGERFRGDIAFNTQPGHIPERAWLIAREDRAFESLAKAKSMESRADNIEKAADRAIYSDDAGAMDALRTRIAEMEASREQMKKVNAAWRKAGKPAPDNADGWLKVAAALGVDVGELTKLQEDMARFSWQGEPFPAYKLSNLGGRIGTDKARVARLEDEVVHGKPWRYLTARYEGTCCVCAQPVKVGDQALYRAPEIKHYQHHE